MTFAIAKKLNMSQMFTDAGKVVPVTVLQLQNHSITAIRTIDKDGYSAIQLQSYGKKKEFKTQDVREYKIGQSVKNETFIPGQEIKVTGVTRGRGTAGVMKRHGFHGAPASHGHDHPRAVGSIGQAFPQHVRKGLRMAGHMGNVNHTIKSVVISVDSEQGLLMVKGSVPGSTAGLVKVVTTGKEIEPAKMLEYIIQNEDVGVQENHSDKTGEVTIDKVTTEVQSDSGVDSSENIKPIENLEVKEFDGKADSQVTEESPQQKVAEADDNIVSKQNHSDEGPQQ